MKVVFCVTPAAGAPAVPKLILASASPARAKLLTDWGFEFEIRPTNFDEDSFKQTISDPKTLVETLAQEKANQCAQTITRSNDQTILAADTIVVFNRQIIGKPADRDDAKRIISLLAGQTHQVWTGVCLITVQLSNDQTIKRVFSDVASVTFKPMTDAEIETYLYTNDWVGKAGAYQLYKSINPYVESVVGDPATVLGLPTSVLTLL